MAHALGAAVSPALGENLASTHLHCRRYRSSLQARGSCSRSCNEAALVPGPASVAKATRASTEANSRAPLSQTSEFPCQANITAEPLGCCPSRRQPLSAEERKGRTARTARDAPCVMASAPSPTSTSRRAIESVQDSGSKEPPDHPADVKRAVLPFLFPALGGMLFGYDIGATSGALISIKDPVLSGTDWGSISATATGLIVSGSLAGALLGSALAFLVADPLGRRRELILAAVLYAAGAACTAGAPSLPFLLLGRLIFGLGIGLAMHGAPMYIAETSPASIRGTLISLKEGFIVGGILLGYLSGSLFISDVGGWREMFALGVPLALVMGAGMAWLPPSPRWLLLQCSLCEQEGGEEGPPRSAGASKVGSALGGSGAGELEGGPAALGLREGLLRGGERDALRARALAALQRLRGPSVPLADLEAEVKEILQSLNGEGEGAERRRGQGQGRGEGEGEGEGRGASTPAGAAQGAGEVAGLSRGAPESEFGALFTGTNGAALRIAGGLVVFQQITGQPSVLYYAASILQDAGFSGASDATKVAALLGLFKLLMTGVAVVLVDSAGRRPLLLTGVSGLVLSLVALGTVYQLDLAAPLLSVAALLLYVGSYQVSFGPISWLMVSEIFALRVRGRAQSVATLLNFGSNALVTFALPPIQESIGQAWTFYSFGAIGMVAIAFIFSSVPETKGLTLEQIQAGLAPGGASNRSPV